MNFALKKIQQYCDEHSSPQDDILYQLERETHLKTLAPQMMSGAFQGQMLKMIAQMMDAKYALEIGTFTGYAAISIARGLQDGGVLTTIEVKQEVADIASKYFDAANLQGKINLIVDDAIQAIPKLETVFDLVFIDAGKHEYMKYFELSFEKLRPGGVLLVDNVLWSGKVIQKEQDLDTSSIHAFNEHIMTDDRVENIMLPIRDGLSIIRKK